MFTGIVLAEAMRRVIGECFADAQERHIEVHFESLDSMPWRACVPDLGEFGN